MVTRSCCSMGGKTSGFGQKSKRDTGNRVLQRVRHHPWTQTLSPVGKQSEHDSVHSDQQHAAFPFVTMTGAEHNSGGNDSKKNISGDRRDLPLQVSAENNFFHETGDGTESHPQGKLQAGLRNNPLEAL